MDLRTPTGTWMTCPGCAYANAADALVCGLCGHLLRAAASARPAAPPVVASWAPGVAGVGEAAGRGAAPRRLPPWGVLLVGAVLAPVFGLTPLLQRMGWFLGSLVHEMGHVLVSWFFGQAAVPAIRLDGHAAAIHKDQEMLFVVAIGAALGWVTWALRRHPRWMVAAGLVTLLYPLLALTRAREVLFLLAGHGGEIAIGAVFLWRARGDGFTGTLAERLMYATTGFFLLGRNVVLCHGLMTSHAARAHYAHSGSFGLTNDLLRIAHEHLLWPLPRVAGLVLVLTVVAAALAVFLPRQRRSTSISTSTVSPA